jgi:putrescine importer
MHTNPVVLHRRLTTLSAALFGLSYICPTVVISTFGVLAAETRGAGASAYLVATLAVLLTAASYGRMAARYPEAGSAYTYVSRSVHGIAGFVTGWVLTLDYLFVPMVICLFTAKAFEVVLPGISFRVWVAAVALTTTVINALGITVADRVNLSIMAAQLLVMAALIVICLLYLVSPAHAAHFTLAPFINAGTTVPAVMGGAAIAAYSFLGFDAVTTLSEETLDPTRNIPRATVLAAALGGVIFLVTAFLLGLVHPGFDFRDLDNAGFLILGTAGGPTFLLLFTAVLIVSYIAAVMCAQAGSSRLLYVMGRDGVMPLKAFAYLHPRFRTPLFNIVLMGFVMLIGEFVDVETAASCVNFGAFNAFLAVNLCVLADHCSGRRELPGGALKILLPPRQLLVHAGLPARSRRTARESAAASQRRRRRSGSPRRRGSCRVRRARRAWSRTARTARCARPSGAAPPHRTSRSAGAGR